MKRTLFDNALNVRRLDSDMDVPYNKSGASSRAHYQIVRNVENCNAPHQAEQLLPREVERVQQRIRSKMLSNAELRKELITLLYCMNSSFGSIKSSSLTFALPSAVHLAEAGSRVSEKYIGYLFCWQVMPREHELQLMLVNTIRKDMSSPSTARINLALESLVNLPSADVVPAIHTRCIELLSHPSARIRGLVMNALHSLASVAQEILNDENVKHLVLKRLSDSDEGVVRASLKLSLLMMENDFLGREKIIRPCISLVSRSSDKHTARDYSSMFTSTALRTISTLYEKEEHKAKVEYANKLIPSLFNMLRRSVKYDQKFLVLECFRLLGRFPPTTVAQHMISIPSNSTSSDRQGKGFDKPQPEFIHPVARIRHYLSSRSVNEHILFLSCLACLDPSLWAGTPQPSESLPTLELGDGQAKEDVVEISRIPPVLDQLEVERVLSFLESEDDQIRELTIRILVSLDPSIVENCYARALETLRVLGPTTSANGQAPKAAVQRSIELAYAFTLGNGGLTNEDSGRSFVERIREVIEQTGADKAVNGTIVESVLNRVRRGQPSVQRNCILALLTFLQADDSRKQSDAKPLDTTRFLTLLALACESAAIFEPSSEILPMMCLLATTLHTSPASMQESTLLCLTRLAAVLSPTELSSQEIEDVCRVVHELGEASSLSKRNSVIKRCEQFEGALVDPDEVNKLIGKRQNISLPELALLLDQAHRRPSPAGHEHTRSPMWSALIPASPSTKQVEVSPLSQSKLRYDAYAPPQSHGSNRLARAHSQSSAASERSSNRASSRASSTRPEEDLAKTVTAGDLTLAAGSGTEFPALYKSRKGKIPEAENLNVNIVRPTQTPPVPALDSPFLNEPLIDVDAHEPYTPAASSAYASASTSLRTSPEPDQN